jgi:hypothetical protein
MKPARVVASFDSASAMLSATERYLRGNDFAHLGQAAIKTLPVRASTLLPKKARQSVYAVAGALEGSRPDQLGNIDMDDVTAWVAGHYGRGPYPAVFIGSSNGALVHLAAAVRAPWIPQTLLLPVRRWRAEGADSSDAAAAMRFGERVAGPFLDRNPDIVLHHMHDPNQDELMVRHMAYFRVKLTRLGRSYERWLTNSLSAGAPIVVVDDTSHWPTTRIGARHVFQNGAQGGLEPEYYTGTRPDGSSPEAEWGFEPSLAHDIDRWASAHGHPVHRLRVDCPEGLSAPVADLHRRWGTERGAQDRLLVESFVMLDPFQVARTGAAPLWTMFPVEPSARMTQTYLDTRPPFDVVDAMLFNHGAESAGLAAGEVWQNLIGQGRQPGQLLGVDADRFPVDFAALARYGPVLRALPAAPRAAERHTLAEIIEATGETGAVQWTTGHT